MLTKSAAIQGIVVSESAIARGISIRPQPGSMLGELVASIPCRAAMGLPVTKFEADADSLCHISAGSPRADILLDQFMAVARPAISAHMLFLREKIRPRICDVVEEFKKEVEKRSTLPKPAYCIVKQEIHSVLNDPGILELIAEQKTTDTRPFGPPKTIAAMPKTPEELLEYMKTGDKHTDSEIEKLIMEKGDAFLIEAWSYMTTGTNGSEYSNLASRMYGENGEVIALATLLISNKLFDNPPAEVKMELADYNVALNGSQTAAATRLSDLLVIYDDEVEDELVIQRVLANRIFVNGTVYDKWIADGGSDIILYSIADRNFKYRTLFEIQQNTDGLLKNWEITCAMIAQEIETSRYIIMRDSLFSAVNAVADKSFEDCFCIGTCAASYGYDNANYVLFKKRLGDYMKTLPIEAFDDIWDVAHEVICLCMFPEKNALDFFKSINRAKKKNPDLADRECVSLAAIEYVSKFVVSQFSYN